MPVPKQQYFDSTNQRFLAGGKLYTYAAGTTTPKATYTDSAGLVPQTNPIILNARGEPDSPIYWDGAYKVVLKDSHDSTIYTVDNYKSDPFGVVAFVTNIAASAGSSLIGFILASAAAIKTTVQAKLRERPSLLDFMTDAQRADVVGNVGSIDVSAAVQAAIDAYVDPEAPAGTYLINTPLSVTSDLTIKGKKRKTIFRKTSTTTNTVTRTYVDSSGVTQTLTWDQPVVFNLICPNNSYLTDFNIDGVSFDLPADGSVGAFHGQRVAYSSFRNLHCNNSKFFAKGYDMFQILWENIRTRFSINHFLLDTGTSQQFINVACDLKNATGGSGFVISNLFYSSMYGCAADSLDVCYDFTASQIAMHGCGSESFSRLIRARSGSNIAIHGGALKIYKNAGLVGTYTPYEFDDANTQVTMIDTWLGIANPTDPGGTYASVAITNGAQVTMNNIRNPVELNGGVGNWWFVTGANSLMTQIDSSGIRYINSNGTSRYDGTSNLKAFSYSKTIAAGSAISIFRIAASSYGDSFNGRVRVHMVNGYGVDLGFSGVMEFQITGFKETTTSQNITLIGQTFTVSNTGGGAFGGVTGTLLRNGDNTVDFQLNVANAPAVVGSTVVSVFVDYMTNSSTTASSVAITGV